MLARDEAGKAGIYFLTGINPETGKKKVYIGEAEIIRSRIKVHLKRDFWTTVIFFVSKDENLTKAHIKYLEGNLIDKTLKAGRVELENSSSSGAHLPESDTADMDVFLAKLEQLLPLLGEEFLKPMARGAASPKKSDLLYCEIKGNKATGRQSESGFLVMKGSEAVLKERPSTKRYPHPAILRTQLLNEGVLKGETGRLVFAKDYEFSSPSAAASVIHGGHANGLTAWKDSAGISLKEREQKALSRKRLDNKRERAE
jgi:hypothetical protein